MRRSPEIDVSRLEAEGWLLVEGVLDQERDLGAVLDEYSDVLAGIEAQLRTTGALSPAPDQTVSFDQRFQAVALAAGRSWFQEFDISLPTDVDGATPIHLGPAVFRLLTNPRLLDAVEAVVGPEIEVNPVQHVRVMLPGHVSKAASPNAAPIVTPFHQDQGVLMPEADDTPLLTVWSPLVDAPIGRGCLQVIPRSHKAGLLQHCREKGLSIPDALLPGDPVAVPMKAGDVLFLDRRTIHASTENTSDMVRWSFDLRYQPPGYPSGRSAFPSFLVRSAARPQAVADYDAWRSAWLETRGRLAGDHAPIFYRWGSFDPACA